MSIPFTTFSGRLKQLDTNFRLPIMRDLFDAAFADFEELDRTHAAMKANGVNAVVTVSGKQPNTGRRSRRFAGDTNLPRGRYFTVCDDEAFNDGGTLRDEMYTYYSGSGGLDVNIFDPNVDTDIFERLKEKGSFSPEMLTTPLYLFVYEIARRTKISEPLLGRYADQLTVGEKLFVTYGVRTLEAKIDGVIDLRLPETQEWFVNTFVEMELTNERSTSENTSVSFPPKERLTSFAELLPAIISLETGGGRVFTQAIGAWLRQHGANALIFPSARANARCRVRNGLVTESYGWNMVLYAEAPPVTESNLFGQAMAWVDSDHHHIRVNHTAAGPERGSVSVRGTKEWNLLRFDVERRIARGLIDNTINVDDPLRSEFAIASMSGILNQQITDHVNKLLDSEGEQLWDHEPDTTAFVFGLQDNWPGRDGARKAVRSACSRWRAVAARTASAMSAFLNRRSP